jgi:hypothetical protein
VDLDRRTQQFWLWGGVVSIVAFVIGWVGFAQFLPPFSPGHSAAETAAEFGDRRNPIRTGALIMIVGTMLWVPFAAVIAAQTRVRRGRRPVNEWVQIAAAATSTAVILVAMLFWIVACYRPERDPELTQLMVDAGFIFAIMPFIMFVVWNLGVTLAILTDTRESPAYPRWAAYFSVWCAVLYLPGGALAYFHDGPFAWNGLIAFFIPAIAFFVWILVMTYLTFDSIKRADDGAPAGSAASREELAYTD